MTVAATNECTVTSVRTILPHCRNILHPGYVKHYSQHECIAAVVQFADSWLFFVTYMLIVFDLKGSLISTMRLAAIVVFYYSDFLLGQFFLFLPVDVSAVSFSSAVFSFFHFYSNANTQMSAATAVVVVYSNVK